MTVKKNTTFLNLFLFNMQFSMCPFKRLEGTNGLKCVLSTEHHTAEQAPDVRKVMNLGHVSLHKT